LIRGRKRRKEKRKREGIRRVGRVVAVARVSKGR